MSADAVLRAFGMELDKAFVSGVPVEPLSARGVALDIAAAYRIQTFMLARRISVGVPVVGRKIGATSAAVQKAVGIDQPDFGLLLGDCAFGSGAAIDHARFIQPRAEGEIAFVLSRDLAGPGITAADVLAAVDHVAPCIEIVDSRIADWRIGIIDTIADNASCGAFVIGSDRVDPSRLDLAACRMQMRRNGSQAAEGFGSASLGHPANAVAWLANTLGALDETLKAGEPILSGSLGPLVPVARGDRFELTIEGIGSCSVAFD